MAYLVLKGRRGCAAVLSTVPGAFRANSYGDMVCEVVRVVPHNNRLQRTVLDKVPMRMRQRAAAEPERYAP
jgi:hypothetical protein